MTHRIAGAAVFAALVFAGCSGTSSSSRDDSDSSKTTASGVARKTADPNAEDVRVMFYQPPGKLRSGEAHGDLAMILVNESHRLRATDQGRYAIALQDPNRAYNVMTEEQATSLLASLENYGLSEAASPFVEGDEALLTPAAANDRYRGVIVVERGTKRLKVVGMRPAGQTDVAGQRRYKQFVDMKGAVAIWARATASELPIGGAANVPRATDR
jgi:hypothetical protein